MIIDSKILKAAMMFQAKNDPRYYLMGVHLSNHGRVEATNGHIGILIDCEELKENEKSHIISIHGTIPNKAGNAFIEIVDEKKGFITFEKKDEMLAFSIINAKYVDFERVLPKEEDKKPVDDIGVNPDYILQTQKALRVLSGPHTGVKLQFYGQHKAIKATLEIPTHKAFALIMPMRV